MEEEIENLENYEPDGFHPVDLFDVLDGRFKVIYKLGFGGIAMVWLCYELEFSRWRAVKINAASHSSGDSPELKILQTMRDKGITPAELDAMHIVVPFETFWLEGPNGRHLCSVMPVMGPRLSEWREELPTNSESISKICYQLTEGLSYLHDIGVAHGDFRPANVLTQLERQCLDDISVDEMKRLLDAPEMEEVLTLDGEPSSHAPKFVVTGVQWDRLEKLISDDVAIVDFGESYLDSQPPSSLGIPRQYAAPEVLFDGTPTISSDIWSLAYTLMEVQLGTNVMGNMSSIIWRMEQFAGPVPEEDRETAVEIIEEELEEPLQLATEDFTNPKTNVPQMITADLEDLNKLNESLAEGTDYTDPLEIILGAEYIAKQPPPEDSDQQDFDEWGPYRLPPDQVAVFADLLRGMFKYAPGERLTASKALGHVWFGTKRKIEDTEGETTLAPAYANEGEVNVLAKRSKSEVGKYWLIFSALFGASLAFLWLFATLPEKCYLKPHSAVLRRSRGETAGIAETCVNIVREFLW